MPKLPALQRLAWLERARDAKSDQDRLVALVAAWQASPSLALCELVEAAGRRVQASPRRPVEATDPPRPDLSGRDLISYGELRAALRPVAKSNDHAQWLAAADRRDAVDLDALLATIQTRSVDLARERAERLARWPSDPRIATAIVRMLPRTSMRGRTSRPFWTIMFRILHRQFHGGIAAAIREVDEAEIDGDFGDYVDMKLQSLRRRLDSLREAPALDDSTRSTIAVIREALGIDQAAAAQSPLDDFLAEIWASPNDDGLREVFADWLTARDDPRGEFIILQLTKKRRALDVAAQKREATLLKAHAREWMGPIEPAVDKKQFRFVGGFLYACKVNTRGLTTALCTHPAWSTVREYDLDRGVDLFLDHMIALGAKRK